jgi:hypothetical protein
MFDDLLASACFGDSDCQDARNTGDSIEAKQTELANLKQSGKPAKIILISLFSLVAIAIVIYFVKKYLKK